MSSDRLEVTSADIARIAGVKPTAVSNWRRRHDDFPQPVGGTDRSPRFLLAEVEAWLARHGRAVSADPGLRLWQAFETVRQVVTAEDGLHIVGGLLAYLRRHPDTPSPAGPRGWSRLLADALADTPVRAKAIDVAQAETFLRASYEVGASGGSVAAAFEDFLARYLAQAAPAGFAPTPRPLAELMVSLAGAPTDGAFFDPACGSGGILLAAATHGHRRLFGQERDPALVALAVHRGALRGLDEPDHWSFQVGLGDSLLNPMALPEAPAAVVTAPPFAERQWGHSDLVNDPRWEYGLPPRTEPELAWVQHALSQVRPGGPVVILMPPGAAFRPAGRRIRRALLTSGALRAVISLPVGLATHYALALQIWVLHRPDESSAPPEHVLLVDTADAGGEGGRRVEPDAAWQRVRDVATESWHTFTADPAAFVERPGVARAMPVTDLLGEEIDLTPRRHLPLPTPEPLADPTRERRRLTKLLALLTEEVPDVGSLPALDRKSTREVTLQELAKAGVVFLRRPATHERGSGAPDHDATATVKARVLTGVDLVQGNPPSEVDEVDADEVRNPPIRAGDVLVPAVTRTVVARVATEDDAGAYPARSVLVVRTDRQVLDPWYLAGFLSSAEGGRRAEGVGSSLGGAIRVDLRRLRLPLPPIEVQRAYGEAFRRLSDYRRNLRAAHDLGQQLIQDLTNMITTDLTTDRAPKGLR